MRRCLDCGADLTGTARARKRCESCSDRRERRMKLERQARARTPKWLVEGLRMANQSREPFESVRKRNRQRLVQSNLEWRAAYPHLYGFLQEERERRAL